MGDEIKHTSAWHKDGMMRANTWANVVWDIIKHARKHEKMWRVSVFCSHERAQNDQGRLQDDLDCSSEALTATTEEFPDCWAAPEATGVKLSNAFRDVCNRRSAHEEICADACERCVLGQRGQTPQLAECQWYVAPMTTTWRKRFSLRFRYKKR